MPFIKRRFGVSAARGLAMIGALGLTASSLQATPEPPADTRVRDHAPDLLRNCDGGERGTRRFDVERAGGGTRTVYICDAQDRGDLSATARALSAAIDAAPPPSGFTPDSRTLDLLSLRLTRARTEMNTRMDVDARNRRLAEIDDAIRGLEN